jgi:PAS domain S-box-containing protein
MVTSEPIKFLLVDDMSENLLALEAIIRRKGLEVLVARSGSDALELLLVHDVSLALLDVQMPGMDGFELAELMRGVERTKHVPIIFVTAGTRDPQRVFKGYESGAVDFLFKPIDPHILKSKADVFFDLACQRRETAQIHEEMLAMNEALMLGSQRQRELIEVGDSLNVQLQSEIRERKLAEEALAKAAAELAAIQTAISEAALIAITDVTGKIEQVNDNFVRISKYSREELIGQDHRLLNSGLHPKEFIRDLWVTIANGKVWRNEIRNRAKDGSLYWVDTTIAPILIECGKPVKYIAVRFDITARKLVEEEQKKLDQRLRDQQFYTRSLIESNIDAIMTTDPSGIITDVNKQMEALTGCTRDELIGAPFKDYFTDPQRAEAAIKRVLHEKSVTDYELTARARDGKQTVVSYNATTFYDRSRKLEGVFAAARDVTERKRFEAELQQAKVAAESASRTKSDFLASMSHEIRTPMNAIMGIADLLAKTALSTEQDKFVQIFRRAGDNLLSLINDILDLSKVEASQLELERTGFSLNDYVVKVIELVALRAHEKGLALVYEIAPSVSNDLVGDPTRLLQVLLNLLGNAIKFTNSGGVSLLVEPDPDSLVPIALRFTVSDTGIGIPGEKLGQVFERFTQADSSITRRFGGSGLGLTISKCLVELMGGRIWVASEVGKGSVFAFVVPFEIWTACSRPVAGVPVGMDPELPLPALRILLAEDSPDNCTITLAYLEDTPYRVEIAETGAIACEMFAAGHYDLVLMDRQMPVMDGLTATRTIRAWERANDRPTTPIIALTASALKGDQEMCLVAGCTAFLTKPIKQEVLLQAIKERSTVAPPSSKEETSWKDTILVRVNPKFADRIPAYLQNCRQNVITIPDALDRGDFETVTTLGHQMRGSGSMFGFQAITDFGAALEQAAESADTDASRKWAGELSTYLDRVEIISD